MINRAKHTKQDFFITPEWIADLMAEKIGDGTVLEPCAGSGALINALLRKQKDVKQITAYEIDKNNVNELKRIKGLKVFCRDFLKEPSPKNKFDFAIVNPPYSEGLHLKFLEHLLSWAEIIVVIVPNMSYHHKKGSKFSSYIIDELWNPAFCVEFKAPTAQLSIFTLKTSCSLPFGKTDFTEKLYKKYYGKYLTLKEKVDCKEIKSLGDAESYTGQKNSIVFCVNSLWVSSGNSFENFLIDCPDKNNDLVYYKQNITVHKRIIKKGDLKNYPCIIYKNDAEKEKIISFYKKNYNNFKKEIVKNIQYSIPLWFDGIETL